MELVLKHAEPIAKSTFDGFEAHPVTGTFGATISGLQITETIDNDALFNELHRAWIKYQVLFFRDQELTPEQHLAVGKRFGEIQKQGYAEGIGIGR